MNMKKTQFGFVISMLILTVFACSFNVTTANFNSAQMATDPQAENPATTFSPQDTFYAVIDLDNAPDDTNVRAEWYAVDVEGEDPNTKIDQAQLTTGSNQLHFKLENTSPWPKGDYKVDLFINDKLEQTLEFQVE